MSKILFVNGSLHGHFNPTLPVVKELVKRGDEVWYYCSSIFRDILEEAGVQVLDSDEDLGEFYKAYVPTGNHPFYTLLEYMVRYYEEMIPSLLRRVNDLSFDFAICDSILGAPYFVKRILKIPVISSHTSFAMDRLPIPENLLEEGTHPQLDEFYRSLRLVCQRWSVEIPTVLDFFISKGDRNIVYTSKMFNPGGERFDASYNFVGPSLSERVQDYDFPMDELVGHKVIYISLGTINTRYEDFYRMCMEAFRDTDVKVIMSIGKTCDIISFERIPDNFTVKNFVPQLKILEQTNLFITHAGMNSVNESLSYGVPMITIPLVNDQFMVAKQVEKLGLGIIMKMNEITAEDLKETALKIMSDSRYLIACEEISRSFLKAGGYMSAVDCIQEYGGSNGYKE
jgi:MGT family glycosyltransferase